MRIGLQRVRPRAVPHLPPPPPARPSSTQRAPRELARCLWRVASRRVQRCSGRGLGHHLAASESVPLKERWRRPLDVCRVAVVRAAAADIDDGLVVQMVLAPKAAARPVKGASSDVTRQRWWRELPPRAPWPCEMRQTSGRRSRFQLELNSVSRWHLGGGRSVLQVSSSSALRRGEPLGAGASGRASTAAERGLTCWARRRGGETTASRGRVEGLEAGRGCAVRAESGGEDG